MFPLHCSDATNGAPTFPTTVGVKYASSSQCYPFAAATFRYSSRSFGKRYVCDSCRQLKPLKCEDQWTYQRPDRECQAPTGLQPGVGGKVDLRASAETGRLHEKPMPECA